MVVFFNLVISNTDFIIITTTLGMVVLVSELSWFYKFTWHVTISIWLDGVGNIEKF